MQRECTHCHRPFTRLDFDKDESKCLEADRKATGVKGVHFLSYHCPDCDFEGVFVHVFPLEGETAEAYRSRKEGLEATARRVRAERIEVVIQERKAVMDDEYIA